MSFRALVTDRDQAGATESSVQELDENRLPPGNVTVDVEWAGLNYKDGLCLTGAGGLVRTYPHVAGIDFAGIVSASSDARYAAGDRVILTGWRVGETYWGGYAEKVRVDADWLVPAPEGLGTRDAMVIGTAGLTAMLAIERLEWAGLRPESGPVLVTGAAGGVGSIAIMLLAKLGYEVVALSGRSQHRAALAELGAASVLDRNSFLAEPDKVLESARYAGALDNVGGKVLAKLLRQIKYGGHVASIGNAGGIELETNVLPFILRGINLLGIDSVMQPYAARVRAWERITRIFDFSGYADLVREVELDVLPAAAAEILAGQVNGRVVVRLR